MNDCLLILRSIRSAWRQRDLPTGFSVKEADMASVRFENGTSYKVEDKTSVIDHFEGAVTSKATAADGTSATGTAYTEKEATDRAIHNAESKRQQ